MKKTLLTMAALMTLAGCGSTSSASVTHTARTGDD